MPTPEANPLTATEIESTYLELVGIWNQVDALQEQIAELSGQASDKMLGLSSRAHESGLPDDESRFIAAALFRGANSEEDRNANIEALIDIDQRIRASRGQAVLWLSSETIHHAGWSSHGPDEIKEKVHVGRLTNDATLRVGEYGTLTAPLIQGYGTELRRKIRRDMYEPDHPLQHAWIPLLLRRGSLPLADELEPDQELTIEAKDLSKPELCIGDAEVEAEISQVDDDFKPQFINLSHVVRSKLF